MELSDDQLRDTQLKLLDAFVSYCRRHGLTYYLAWGTLLGAIRHQGYIPWDDDVDLMMPRTDYRRFVDLVATGQHVAPGISVGAFELDRSWPNPYAKLIDKSTRLENLAEIDVDLGVYIDVFPIDGFPQRPIGQWMYSSLWRLISGLMAMQIVRPRAGRAAHKAGLLRASKLVLRRVPRPLLMSLRERLAATYGETSSGEVGVSSGPSLWHVGGDKLEPRTTASFEGRVLAVPRDYDAVLEAIYGDYTTLPPPEKRVRHHTFRAFSRD